MPATTLTPVQVTHAGITTARTAADGTNGNIFANTNKTFFEVLNASGGSINVTVQVTAVDGSTYTKTIACANSSTMPTLIYFDPRVYGNSVTVGYSAATSVTVRALYID